MSGALRYYYRGTDSALYFLNGASLNTPPYRAGGAITSTPYVLDEGVPSQPDRANVFARGADGHLYVYNTASKAWTDLGGTVA